MSVETVSEAAVITRGQAVYTRVKRSEWHVDGDAIEHALSSLLNDLETYWDLVTRTTDPSDAYFDLDAGDGAYGQALSKTAADAAEWIKELDRLVPESSNEEGGVAA